MVEYLERVAGMAAKDDPDAFWAELEAAHGDPARELRASVLRGEQGDPEQRRWVLKNATLDLSLDVSTGFSGAMYRAQLRGLVERLGGPTRLARVVDVGCENGLLTLFIAQLVPDAEVVGIDQSATAVARATELATRLHVENAMFVVGDFRNPPSSLGDANLLLCSRVLSANTGSGEPAYYTLADAPAVRMTDPLARDVEALMRLLTSDGAAIIAERLANSLQAWRFVQALALAGAGIDWHKSGWIEGHEVGTQQRWPILVASRDAPKPGIEDILHFYTRAGRITSASALEDVDAAELLYLSEAQAAALIGGVQLEYYAGGTERLEMRRGRDRTYAWLSSTLGFRRLAEVPDSGDDALLDHLRIYAEEREADALATFYDRHSIPGSGPND